VDAQDALDQSLATLLGAAKETGFQNIDLELQAYRIRINGKEMGIPMTWDDCEIVLKWIRGFAHSGSD
jgi:hypothetical protein